MFSAAVHLLMLAGLLSMLQVCDHVPARRSVPTLIALTVLLGRGLSELGDAPGFR